jgi:hypothetical protein
VQVEPELVDAERHRGIDGDLVRPNPGDGARLQGLALEAHDLITYGAGRRVVMNASEGERQKLLKRKRPIWNVKWSSRRPVRSDPEGLRAVKKSGGVLAMRIEDQDSRRWIPLGVGNGLHYLDYGR